MVFFGSGSQSLALVIFIISFGALTIIQKTLEMRSAGIRYISGIRRYQLFGHSLMEDGKELFIGCIGGSVLGAILIYYLQLTPFAYSLIISASIIYNTLLFILSTFLSFFFAFSIQTVHLVSLLKGKIPLKRVLFFLFTVNFLQSLSLVSQFIVSASMALSGRLIKREVWLGLKRQIGYKLV